MADKRDRRSVNQHQGVNMSDINRTVFNKFISRIVGVRNSDSMQRRDEYRKSLDFLGRFQKENDISDPIVAYNKLKEKRPTFRNYKLKSDLGIFMNWYTIHTENSANDDDGKEVKDEFITLLKKQDSH